MIDFDVVSAKVEEAGDVRHHIAKVLNKQFQDANKQFQDVSMMNVLVLDNGKEIKPGTVFRWLVDAIHYIGGGYPDETSLGRLEAKLAPSMISLYVLEKIGLTAEAEQAKRFCGVKSIEFDEMWFACLGIDTAQIETLASLVRQAVDVQRIVCEEADKVKIELYQSLPKEVKFDKDANPSGMKSSDFVTLAKIHVKRNTDEAKQKLIDNLSITVSNKEFVSETAEKVL